MDTMGVLCVIKFVLSTLGKILSLFQGIDSNATTG